MVRGTDLFFALFNNLAIFIALVAAYGFLIGRFEKSNPLQRQAWVGLAFGFFAIGCMYAKIPVYEGVIVDQRNAVVALSGAFGGPLAALVSAILAASYRVYLGGGGVLAGAVGVCLAAVAGIGLHRFHRRMDNPGLAAAGALFATILILPGFLLVGNLQTGWTLLKGMALPYGTAIFLGIFLVSLLLTHEERRQETSEALRDSEIRLNTILSNVGAYIYIKDTNYRYTYANSKACELLGRDLSAILGADDSTFFSPDSVEEILRSDRRVIENGEAVSREEADVSGPDGHPRTYWAVKLPLRDSKGEIYGLCGISTDITEKMQMEADKQQLVESLHQSQKMEAIGTLAGGIAHDFNNILGAIMGYAELTLEGSGLAPGHRKNLEQILAASERARELVLQILAYSRKGQDERKPGQLHLLVEDALALLRKTIPSVIDIRVDLDPDTGYALVNATQIHQVVMNLCSNAYAAMKSGGGTLSVRLAPAPEAGAQPGDGRCALLTVRDTGVGMAPEVLERVFDPYFTTKGPGEGSGMGLSVVHGIVRRHGGRIDIDSRPGEGTTVRVYLPLSEAPTGQTVALPDQQCVTGDEHVLLVDDDPVLASLAEEQLVSLGYRVTATTSPKDALDIFSRAPGTFDALVTDQTMPEMTGATLATEVMRVRPDFPVVICTGHSDILDESIARELGVRAFLMKPVHRGSLAQAVRRAIDGPTGDS
jgi:PAS domain S-box-containing protein